MWHQKAQTSILLGLLIFALAGSSFAETLSKDVRWSGKVSLSEPVIISRGATLTIAAGTHVTAANAQVKISVRGEIQVNGSEAAPVIFDGAKGWLGIEFMEAPANSVIRWAEISSSQAAISSFATDFKVENCTFKANDFGVKLLRESSPLIAASLFDGNKIGVSNEMKSGPQIRDNRFVGQTESAILASHNSIGAITGNVFEKNKQGVSLLQKYKDRISGNRFIENEVAVYCNQTQSTPLIEENVFHGNDYGVLNFSFAYPIIRNNRFEENKTAVHNDQYGSPLVEHNVFRDNGKAMYSYRKSNPKVYRNLFEKNQLALYCDFSSYPEVKDNNFIDNEMGVELGIYQSADWEKRSGSKKIMQREATTRQSQNPLLARAPEAFEDFVDVTGNWWGDKTSELADVGGEGNSQHFFDRHDKPKVTYKDYGPGVYLLDLVRFSPWLKAPVEGAGLLGAE